MIHTAQRSSAARPAPAPFVRMGVCMLQAALLAALTRPHLTSGLTPFAPACFAAGMACGWNPLPMLIGCAAGIYGGGTGEYALLPLLSCTLIALSFMALRLVPALRRYARQEGPAAAAAAICTLVPGAALSGMLAHNLISAVLSAAAAGLLAPALISGLQVRPDRRLLTPEEQLSLCIVLFLAVAGLRSIPAAGKTAGEAAAALITLLISGAGASCGAMAGLGAGMALALGGGNPFAGAALGLGGLASGCAKELPRPWRCAALGLGSLLSVTQGIGFSVGGAGWPALAIASAAYCLLPAPFVSKAIRWTAPPSPHADAERLAVRMKRRAGRRLSELSSVFGELADGYGEGAHLPGEGQLISDMRQSLCAGCGKYAVCWQGDEPPAARFMCRMAAEALSGRGATPVSELPPDAVRHCRRSSQIDRRLTPMLARISQERQTALKRGEARGLMARQFRETQRLMNALSTQLGSSALIRRDYGQLAAAVLDKSGIRTSDVLAVLDGRMEFICRVEGGVWSTEAASRAAACLTSELGVPFVASTGRAAGECELLLTQIPALTAKAEAVCASAQPGMPCGDSHLICRLPDGRLIAAISDGMGSGEAAHAESRRCISLLRKFVSAGVERDAALSAVNSLMLLRSQEETFATADLCVIDLFSGSASFSKLGACRSYLLHGSETREIAGGQLPMGILDQVEPGCVQAEIFPGDLLIMLSDGAADELKPEETEAFRALLPGVRGMAPGEAARYLMEHAPGRTRADPDDTTILVLRAEAVGRGGRAQTSAKA